MLIGITNKHPDFENCLELDYTIHYRMERNQLSASVWLVCSILEYAWNGAFYFQHTAKETKCFVSPNVEYGNTYNDN